MNKLLFSFKLSVPNILALESFPENDNLMLWLIKGLVIIGIIVIGVILFKKEK